MNVNSLSQLLDAILLRKFAFLVTFFFVFLGTYAALAWLDFLPELVKNPVTKEVVESDNSLNENIQKTSTPTEEVETQEVLTKTNILPLMMTIESLDKNITILNPESRDIADLDEALLNGVVRHPDSATLDQTGTLFILGHSSYLPVVRNKNFQALNGIQDLKWGDIIKISASEGEYVYRVDKVYRAKAQEVTVPIAGQAKRLFLATCNSFGSTDDRYVVEAELVEEKLY